jgi:hypothetical protein
MVSTFYLETALANKKAEKQNQKILKRYSERVTGKPFWYWDKEEHKAAHSKDKDCCWVHILGLPRKNGRPHALYDYEKLVIDSIEDIRTGRDTKHKGVYCLKATGLGLTTLMLYYISYIALKDNALHGKNIAVITGPRQELSVDLNRRLRALFPDIIFESKETVTELNKCRIEIFPSHSASC